MKDLTLEEQRALHSPCYCGDTIILVGIVNRLYAEIKRLQDAYAEVESIFPRVQLLCDVSNFGGVKFKQGEVLRVYRIESDTNSVSLTNGKYHITGVSRSCFHLVTVTNDIVNAEAKKNAKASRDRYFAAHGYR